MDINNLTKEQAIAEHRKMWNWIADRLEEHHPGYDVYMYKMEYMEKNFPYDNIRNDCFCCQYAVQENDDNDLTNFCVNCPLIWGTETNTNEFFCERGNYDIPIEDLSLFDYGLWIYADKLTQNGYYSEAAKVARQIANLPER